MALRHPPNISHVSVLRPAPWKRYVIGAIFVVLYGVVLQFCFRTSGQPYEWALAEQKRMVKEKAEVAKETGISFSSGQQGKETDLAIDYESLPSPYLPNAWACAAIFVVVSCHILFHLICHWSIAFRSGVFFQTGKNVGPGCYLRISPRANKGVADICHVWESEVTLKYHFNFQYQLYEYLEADEEDAELLGDSSEGGVRLIQCPTNLPWREYKYAKGFLSEDAVEKATDRYGSNVFDLPRPTFGQIYRKQLMSPLVIFQFFCTALWMMDTYWRYTCFTLVSILGYEASMAFQRLKSMATLRGMSTKSYSVYVYRRSEWEERPIEDLLPGDLVSLTSKKAEAEPPQQGSAQVPQESVTTVPCDCIVLRGGAIVNEASLTGESVPQMKDTLSAGSDTADERIDAFGKHRVHVLFSGTSLIQATPAPKALEDGDGPSQGGPPDPPNDGIVCYVIRTGFNSSQGELMRMIEFSQQDVGADKWEMCLQLLFLLCFALVAAGYVLKKGLEDPTKPTYKTLLRCTLIITSVVPPSLPMQMAFAVHTALMALLKGGIFCTEPFRVPYAGRIQYCFFDKTGTLTSDQMVAVGVVNSDLHDKTPHLDKSAKEIGKINDASTAAAMVISGCHSLIEHEGKAIGDPIEVAALSGVGWSYIPSTATASPGPWRARELYIEKQRQFLGRLKDEVEADRKEKEELTKKLTDLEKTLKAEKEESNKIQVRIEQRFHFSSELQRMSTVCSVNSQSSSSMPSGAYCLTKGSPEAIGKLCASKPDWYNDTYKGLAEKGQRVLALAYRQLDSKPAAASQFQQKGRDVVEQDLTFAGFISFKCDTRKDSGLVVKSLNESAHYCVMLTGDAPLTALSVAVEVGIASGSAQKALILSEVEDTGKIEWTPAITSGEAAITDAIEFNPGKVNALSQAHDLVVTGRALELALQREDAAEFRKHLGTMRIYARLSPQQKEDIIQAVAGPDKKIATLMCGDGGNDVGALKTADIGVALLSGFGGANAGGDEEKELAQVKESEPEDKGAEDALAELRKDNSVKATAIAKKANEEMARKRKDLMGRQQEWVQEEIEARRQRGEDVGFMGQMSAMKVVMSRLKTELKSEQDVMQKKHGNAFAASAAKGAMADLDSMEETPMVKLGDASTAAPFTTRTPSIGACVDIVRQGRCTLLSAVQQMEIMMLESMIGAYTMSAMSVDGTRPSEAQMMASGSLISVASLAFSFAKPLDKMHKVRPLSSVFHPAILFSMLGQVMIHLGCMIYIARLAKDIMGEEALQEIIEFEKTRNEHIESLDEDAMSEWNWFMSVPFKPNLLNTCCWLVETSQQISVIFVNYKGRPWMKGLMENQPLFLSLFGCVALVAICAWGVIPYLNEVLNLLVVPEGLRHQVIIILFVSLIGSFLWDRLMVFIFAKEIWGTMVEGAQALKFADFIPILKTVGYIVGGGAFLCLGNPILWFLGWMLYRQHKKSQEPTPALA